MLYNYTLFDRERVVFNAFEALSYILSTIEDIGMITEALDLIRLEPFSEEKVFAKAPELNLQTIVRLLTFKAPYLKNLDWNACIALSASLNNEVIRSTLGEDLISSGTIEKL